MFVCVLADTGSPLRCTKQSDILEEILYKISISRTFYSRWERRQNMEERGGLVNVWLDLCVNLTDVGIAPQRCRGAGWLGKV